MNVTFYKGFSKRINSTLRPTMAGTTLNCRLKEDCSKHEPILLLNSQVYDYDYALIQWAVGDAAFYFVTDVVSKANNLVEYHLKEDVLATYKVDIGNTIAHIAFSASDYDPMIIDPRIQVLNSKTANGSTDIQDRPVFYGGGYILTVFSGDVSVYSTGISTSYWLDDEAMDVCRKWLTDTAVYTAIYNYLKGYKPMDGVFGLVWVPYTIPAGFAESADDIYIGPVKNSDTGVIFPAGHKPQRIKNFQMSIQNFKTRIHLRYTDFRAYEPYTTGTIYLPGVGNLDLNMGDWRGSQYINVTVAIELITGNVKYLLFTDDGNLVQSADCNVAAACPLGQISTNAAGVMSGLTTLAGGAAALISAAFTGGATAAAAGASALIAGAANTALSANQHGISVSGGFGGRTVTLWPYLNHVEYSIDTEDPTDINYIAKKGRPCNGCRRIGTLSGYVMCDDASVASMAAQPERDEINAYLNSGFYYE